MDLRGKKVLVVGFGRTGKAVCDFLLQDTPLSIKVTDSKKSPELIKESKPYQKKGIEFEIGGHHVQSFLEADLVILSPGVPPIPPIAEALRRGVKTISEIELAFHFLKGKIIGITGSNGKSTVASLVHSILQEGGLKSRLAGNIGTPLIRFALNSSEEDIYVTELSSFQLEYIESFSPDVSVILNITPDHLNWHETFSSYLNAKIKLLKNQKKNQTTILNRDDPNVWPARKQGPKNILAFSIKNRVRRGCFLQGDWIVLKHKTEQKVMDTGEIPLKGIHNQENVMASILAGYVLQVPVDKIRKTIRNFQALEHRLEKVLSLKGVDFYNDSKATNIDAALKSIMSFDKKIILILGGRDKGGDFSRLKKEIKKRVKKIIVLGEAREKIIKSLGHDTEIKKAESLKQAVEWGYENSNPGDTVLLAPACTSFDMFENFEHRGKVFKQEVKKLSKKTNKADN